MSAQVLLIGHTKKFWGEMEEILSRFGGLEILKYDDMEEVLDLGNADINPLIALLESKKDTLSTNEWAQAVKMTLPHVPLLVIYTSEDEINAFEVKKSGANKLVQRPYDDEFIVDAMLEIAPFDFDKKIPVAALEAIRLNDFKPNSILECDVYTHLPSNQKTICVRKKGTPIDNSVIDKIKKSKGQQLYVKKSELPYFYKYASKILKEAGASSTISMTEKTIKLRTKIQNFMGVFLDSAEKSFDEGKELTEQFAQIVEELEVMDFQKPDDIYMNIIALTEKPCTNYNSAINVAVYASLFAKIIGYKGNIKNISVGGLLHNIGIARLPLHIAKTNFEKLNAEDKAEFRKYPIYGINLVKGKKVPIEPEVVKVIEQHQERMDGSGFPKGIRSHVLTEEAKILGIAIRFNELTCLRDGHEAYTPDRAFQIIMDENDPSKVGVPPLDFIKLKKIKDFFDKEGKKLESLFNTHAS